MNSAAFEKFGSFVKKKKKKKERKIFSKTSKKSLTVLQIRPLNSIKFVFGNN